MGRLFFYTLKSDHRIEIEFRV